MIFDLEPALPQADQKRMLDIQKLDKWHVHINFSSLDVIANCPRKALYQLIRKCVPSTEGAATLFGKAIHKALELWYTLPIDERQLKPTELDRAELMAFGHNIDTVHQGALEAIRQFCLVASALKTLPETDKRSLANGIKILSAYFKFYQDDRLVVLTDERGPMLERSYEHIIYEDEGVSIGYHGTVDMIAMHEGTGELFIVDHKTAASLGRDFINRSKPNHQFSGYIWLAQQAGYDIHKALVNGVQVAKTKCTFERIVTERTSEDFDELKLAVRSAVNTLIKGLEQDQWPMSAPTSCSQYGGCRYLDACQMPKAIRENVLTRMI